MAGDALGNTIPLSKTTKFIVDNRGKTVPTVEKGIALIATNCVTNDHLYPWYESLRFISQETYDTWFRAHPNPGDILLTLKGSQNGAICLVPDPVDFCIAQDMVAIRANEEVVDPLFLFAALRSPGVQSQIKNLDVSGVIPHFKKTDFDKLHLPYPDRTTQEEIGRTYFELSAKIDVNRRMTETLEAMARAVFKSWFVDFDPVCAKSEGRDPGLPKHVADLFPDSFVDSEMGKIPNGWEAGTLADVASLNPENWSKDTRPDTIHYVDLSNTKWGRIESVTAHARQDAPSRAQRVLKPGDTIVGTVRPGNGSYAFVTEEKLTGSTGFAVLRPHRQEYREYVYLAATAAENIEELAHLADGAAYPAVRPEVVAATVSIQPPDFVLTSFAKTAGPLLARIAASDRESRTLAALRDTLLPKLISGELRVRDRSPIVEVSQ